MNFRRLKSSWGLRGPALLPPLLFHLVTPAGAQYRHIICSTPWSDRPGATGLTNRSEDERCGPPTSSSRDERLFVLDIVRQQLLTTPEGVRISVYGKEYATCSSKV